MTPLDKREWQTLLDTYLIKGTIDMELWERLDEGQQFVISEVKKSLNRIKNK